jgi:hypothetical protein
MNYITINYFIILILILILILIYYSILKKKETKEHYCKVPKTNRQGEPNYFDIDLNSRGQDNITNNNCDKYWKKNPNESNSVIELNESIPIPGDQLKLPKSSGQDNLYKFGLINFLKLIKLLNDKDINQDLYNKSTKLVINPITKEKLSYEYEVEFFITNLNNKTDIKRFNEYNPVQKNTFNTINSPINEVNILNSEFLTRINKEQIKIMTKKDLVLNGTLDYQIYNYRIIDIKYIESNINKPLFVLQVNLFQEYNYYINSFTYIGYINENKKSILYNVDFIGILPNSDFLSIPGNDTNLPNNFFILNKNFNDFQPRIKDINKSIEIIDNKKKLNSLASNYACFNTNINSEQTILNYNNKTLCESSVDVYGRQKEVGIYDKPCIKNEECPFYKSNKNYTNNYGGCKNGKCELPTNMKNIGYHYYSYDKNYSPLCYNCDSNETKKKYNILSTGINSCCDKQTNLKSPDYSFNNDTVTRINYYNKKNYKHKSLI